MLKDFQGQSRIFWALSSNKSAGSLLSWFLILLLFTRVGSRAWFPQSVPSAWETMEEAQVELAAPESRGGNQTAPAAHQGHFGFASLLSRRSHKPLKGRSSPAHPACFSPLEGAGALQPLLLWPSPCQGGPGDAEPSRGTNCFVQRCPGSQSSPESGWQNHLQLLKGLGVVFQLPLKYPVG